MRWEVVLGIFVACGVVVLGQAPGAPPTRSSATQAQPVKPASSAIPAASGTPPQTQATDPQAKALTGGKLHGQVKSGNIPLPGVTVTAQNTLTGKRFSTTTDITGAWSLTIPQNGRYVVRTQFAAFANGSQETVLNATSHDQAVNFEILLASRATAQQQREEAQQGMQENSVAQAIRQLAANGAQSLSLMSSLAADTETQAGSSSGSAGAALPSIAGNSDFAGDSVAISGQSGQVSPLAGLDMDRIRDAMETIRAQNGGQGGGNFNGLGGGPGGGPGGGLFGGGGFGGPGGFGGGPGGGRGNFRGFNPGQPHGAVFWSGSNSALNAEPFSLRGQSQEQPASGTNRFGLTFMSAPYIPGFTKPSGKDTMFLTLSGTRSSTPSDQYATVPTDAERTGDIPGLSAPITPVPAAANLLKYFPEPNLPGDTQNYHLLTTAQTNSTQAGVRYMRSLGANATQPGGGRGGFGSGSGSGRRSQNQGLRQSINFNYNWSRSAQDNVNIFPGLGGKASSDANSVQAGYTVGYHKLTNIFNVSWNRSTSQATNYFTNTTDIATQVGILGPDAAPLNTSPLNYGLPNVTLSNFTGLSEQQPSNSIQQTISVSETLSWIHGKHNLRFGGDYRRVHRDFLGGSNSTGTFYFTGLYTGSSLGDFLLGEPQETSIDAAAAKSYLRENVMDMYATDDWRVKSYLTLNYGVRYEFFAPFTEKNDHLAFVETNAAAGFTKASETQAGGTGAYSGNLPDSLVFPFRVGFAPRVGLALRLPRRTVVRAGFGMNYTNSQYSTFASTMARQPMVTDPSFVNEQTNIASTVCASAATDCLSLANGLPKADITGSYAVDPHYRLPYVMVWNLDVQKTLPWSLLLNLGYNGSKGNRLDVTSAPGRYPDGTSYSGALFNYEQAAAFSKFSAGTVRLNRRMSKGLFVGANYQYSHSIDNAGSVGGTSTVVAQNWQDLAAEEGNSSFDVRHSVSGSYVYEFPFGKDKQWLTTGTAAHIFEGLSISGSYTFATGTPLTPSYQADTADVARGTAGSLRPDRDFSQPIAAGGGSQKQWFNTAAFTTPTANAAGYTYGNASRNSIPGPGKVLNDMSLSKTKSLGDTRSMEVRATANNVFNTVQYSGVDTSVDSPTFGQVTSTATMRAFSFLARFRF